MFMLLLLSCLAVMGFSEGMRLINPSFSLTARPAGS
jgi:hypothetical protein